MSQAWNQQEIELLQKSLHLPISEIWAIFEKGRKWENVRTYDSVQKKVRALRDLHKADNIPQDTIVTPVGISSQLEDLSNLRVPTEVIEKQIIQWLVDTSNNYAPQKVKSEAISTDGVSLVILLSDNHFGKKTNSFNLSIAKERVLSMVPEILGGSGPVDRIDEVCLVIAGDNVEGEDIYSNQNGALEVPVIYQAKAASEAYWQLALNLRNSFECRIRIITVPGNHGRMSRTADTRSNWDNVVYMMLSLLTEQNPELDIHVDLNFNDFAPFEVKGKIGVAYHYGTKHLGTPAMQVKYAGWILSKQADFFMHGHWHHWGVETYMGRPMIHNGCLCGPDDLAERMAMEEPPRQSYFFVEKNKPIRTFSFVEWQ